MGLQRASSCIYHTKYHLVWAPKYRAWILDAALLTRTNELFQEIALHLGFDISEMEVDKDHVHLFLSFPQKYSMARVVKLLKSVSSKVIRTEFSGVTQQLWGGEFWEDGYFPEWWEMKLRQRSSGNTFGFMKNAIIIRSN